NSVMTKVWLDAGFASEQVDIPARKLVFRRVRGAMATPPLPSEKPFHPAYGYMQGLVRIMPGTDLTQPLDPEWGAWLEATYGPEKGRDEMQPLLWDTCTVIWIYEKAPLSQAALEAMGAAHCEGVPSYVSPITAWEVGMLSSHGRLQLLIRPERWFSNLFEVPGVRLAEMSPDLLIASSYLPGKPPKDPTDRIIAA